MAKWIFEYYGEIDVRVRCPKCGAVAAHYTCMLMKDVKETFNQYKDKNFCSNCGVDLRGE